MAIEFAGKAAPLSAGGVSAFTDSLRIRPAEMWAVLTVETSGCGFLPDRRPGIRFERHIFHRETGGRFDASAPEISDPRAGGYGDGGADQYERLHRACACDRRAALRSASWGIGQVMGFNAEIAGYRDVADMVAAMSESEDRQLIAMAGAIKHNSLDGALRAHDWQAFSRGYNGPAFADNQYDLRLAAAFHKYSIGLPPDLDARAAQLLLTYLGFAPGLVDGVPGRLTRSALREFQARQGLAGTGQIDRKLIERLQTAVG